MEDKKQSSSLPSSISVSPCAKEGQDEREDYAQQNAGRDGEVKAEVVSPDVDVTRQTAQPEEGKEVGVGQDQTQNDKHESQQDQETSEWRHVPEYN